MTTIKTSTFGSDFNTAFERGELRGFTLAKNWPAALTPDIAALISAYGCEPDEDHDFWGLAEEDTFLQHEDGRWAIVGLTSQGHAYVLQAPAAYAITSRTTGHDFGVYEGTTPEEAIVAMYRDGGYGQGAVWLDDKGEIVVAENLAELLDPTELEATEVQ